MRPLPPSGRQVELGAGNLRAVVVEVGGGLRSLTAGGHELIDDYPLDQRATSGRGQVLIPWPNRLGGGVYEWGGRTHRLPLNEPERGNAIHGLVRWVAWRVLERGPARAVLGHVLHPQPGYPFTLELTVEYALSERGLTVRTTATNAGTEPCPFGAGAHPYLTLGTPSIDGLVLTAPGRSVLRMDGRGLPVGTEEVAGGDLDFREPRRIGRTRLDHGFTGLERAADGSARVRLADPGSGRAVELWVDGSYGYLMLFTGDPLPDVDRHSLAVEPMTCPPDAFRSGEAVVRLEPGDSWAGAWGIEPGRLLSS